MSQCLKDSLAFLASRDKRDVSEYVRLVLEEHVEDETSKEAEEKTLKRRANVLRAGKDKPPH